MPAGDAYLWIWKVPLNVRVEGLLPRGRTLRLRALGMDAGAIRLLYDIEPTVERQGLWPDMCLWTLTARDDLGTEYDDGGGAIGTAPDDSYTDGERALSRTAPDGAAWLELTIRHMEVPPDTPPACVLRIDIPPS